MEILDVHVIVHAEYLREHEVWIEPRSVRQGLNRFAAWPAL
jgi:hypothetical protein